MGIYCQDIAWFALGFMCVTIVFNVAGIRDQSLALYRRLETPKDRELREWLEWPCDVPPPPGKAKSALCLLRLPEIPARWTTTQNDCDDKDTTCKRSNT